MMNIYTAVLTLVLLLVSPKMMAQQNFQTLVDDCYQYAYLLPVINQYFVSNKSEIWA